MWKIVVAFVEGDQRNVTVCGCLKSYSAHLTQVANNFFHSVVENNAIANIVNVVASNSVPNKQIFTFFHDNASNIYQ